MKNYGVWLYHPTEAPEGRIFYHDEVGLKDLEGKGWVDSPDKFSKATETSKPKKAAKKKAEGSPGTGAGSPDNDVGQPDQGGGDDKGDTASDAISEMSKEELLGALREAGVEVDGRTGRDSLEAAYRELIKDEAGDEGEGQGEGGE